MTALGPRLQSASSEEIPHGRSPARRRSGCCGGPKAGYDSGFDLLYELFSQPTIFTNWNIWLSKSITTSTKLRLYMSVVIPTVTYACETWMKTSSITNKLDVFHRRCLRNILRISWRDHITNEEVMRRAGVAPLSDIVSDRRRRMDAHILLSTWCIAKFF